MNEANTGEKNKNIANVTDNGIVNERVDKNNEFNEKENQDHNLDNENNSEEDDLSEQIDKIISDGVKNINKSIDTENKNLDKNIKDYNAIIDKKEKIKSVYGEKISKTIIEHIDRYRKQSDLKEQQMDLQQSQNVTRDTITNIQQQMNSLQKKLSDVKHEEEEGDENPLVSSFYLQRILEYINDFAQKKQKSDQYILEERNKDLQKRSSDFQDEQKKILLGKARKKQFIAGMMQKKTSEGQQINADIQQIYNNGFKNINRRYKKILGLKDKYIDKIAQTDDAYEKKRLIENLRSDVKKMLKASGAYLDEENNKYDKNGNRVETAMEKKRRKKEEKEKKKKEKENMKKNSQINNDLHEDEFENEKHLADNLEKDKEQNKDLQNSFAKQDDSLMKEAYKNYNKLNDKNVSKKLQIKDVSECSNDGNFNKSNILPKNNIESEIYRS